MRARVRLAAWEERVARDGGEARCRRRLPRLREDLAQQRQDVDEGVVMRVRERLEQVKSPLRDVVLVAPREGRQRRAHGNRERGQERRERGGDGARRADDVDGVRFSKLAEALVEAVRDPGAAQLVLYGRVVGGAEGYAVV